MYISAFVSKSAGTCMFLRVYYYLCVADGDLDAASGGEVRED